MRAVVSVSAVGDGLAARLIHVDPLLATEWGVGSGDLPDLSPSWLEARRGVFARALSELSEVEVAADPVAAGLIAERALAEVAWFDSGEAFCEVQAALDSPLFRVRHCFDEMPTTTEDEWALIASRLAQVPASLAGLRSSFEVSRASGLVGAKRQVAASAAASERWAGREMDSGAFAELIAPRVREHDDVLARQLESCAASASMAFGEMSTYLRSVYLPAARDDDAVGPDRFARWSRRYAGSVLDEGVYRWAAQRLAETNADQRRLRDAVNEGAPAEVVDGEAAYLRWAELEVAHAIAVTAKSGAIRSDGLPDLVVRLRPDGGATPYYSPPSEDGTRAATMWWPGGDGPHEVEFDKTVLFHESVPGHHIESSFQRQATWLNRFQRLVYIPGHSEGWGLYAERLAEEIGLIDTPRARLGCRGSHALRLASLLIDIGLHSGFRPPATVAELVGDLWTVDGAIRLVSSQGLSVETASWWVANMLGRPAHRASYAAGERAWLEARRRATAAGEALSDFHHRVLGLGPLGLNQLEDAAG